MRPRGARRSSPTANTTSARSSPTPPATSRTSCCPASRRRSTTLRPSGSITSPAAASYVAGTVTVTANASDGPVPPASGVSAVRFEIKPSGAGAFTVFGTQTAPTAGSTYSESLATGALADGPADLQVVVTDVAGNETTSATHTINIDNLAPTVTLDDPGAAVGSSVGLTATASPDTTDVTFRYRTVGSGGAGTLIASDGTAPFAVTWTTAPAAETQWELIAVATDAGGNVTTSAPRVVLVDRTQPTGSVTAPANGDTTGGPTVAIAANAADLAGSGVTSVVWEVMEFGSAVFTPVATDTSAPYSTTWNSTSSPDGATSIRAVITDAAGNTSTTAAVSFSLDSTGPSVSLADPGAIVGGTIALSATTGGGAARVVFSVAPAGSGTWTEIANDTSAPFGTPFDTSTLPDALYDLRAVGFDALDNASAPALRTNVRFDNTAPILVSSAPADGTVSTSANQIVLTANEPVTAPGALLNGVAAPAPTSLGLDAHVLDGPAPGRHPRPLGRARGRQRRSLAVPRRRLDPEHPDVRSAARGAQHHRRRRLHGDAPRRSRHGQRCRRARGRRRPRPRTTSSCFASTPVRRAQASRRAARSSK